MRASSVVGSLVVAPEVPIASELCHFYSWFARMPVLLTYCQYCPAPYKPCRLGRTARCRGRMGLAIGAATGKIAFCHHRRLNCVSGRVSSRIFRPFISRVTELLFRRYSADEYSLCTQQTGLNGSTVGQVRRCRTQGAYSALHLLQRRGIDRYSGEASQPVHVNCTWCGQFILAITGTSRGKISHQ